MFSFFKKKVAPAPAAAEPAPAVPIAPVAAAEVSAERSGWLAKLYQGLRRTGSSIAQDFTGARIDDTLYEELESALLMADAGVAATQFLLDDLKRRVKESKATEPVVVKALLADAVVKVFSLSH